MVLRVLAIATYLIIYHNNSTFRCGLGLLARPYRNPFYLAAVFFTLGFVASLFFAQRAFIAADIAALPFALNFRLLALITLGSVDLERSGPIFAGPTPIRIALACCRFDISVSICVIMSFVSMTPPFAVITKNRFRQFRGFGQPCFGFPPIEKTGTTGCISPGVWSARIAPEDLTIYLRQSWWNNILSQQPNLHWYSVDSDLLHGLWNSCWSR